VLCSVRSELAWQTIAMPPALVSLATLNRLERLCHGGAATLMNELWQVRGLMQLHEREDDTPPTLAVWHCMGWSLKVPL
jgi:hypothetical protein